MKDLRIYAEKHETTHTVETAWNYYHPSVGWRDIGGSITLAQKPRLIVETEIVFLLCYALSYPVGVETMAVQW